MKELNIWNHNLIARKSSVVKNDLRKAETILSYCSVEMKPHVKGYIRRAKIFLKKAPANLANEPTKYSVKASEEIFHGDKPFDLIVAEKWIQLRKSALKRNKDFNLSMSDVKRLLQRKSCFYTGIRFEPEGSYKRTVDRVDYTKGYVKGNVVVCTKIANDTKNALFESHIHCNMTFQDLFKMMCKMDKKGFRCTLEDSSSRTLENNS